MQNSKHGLNSRMINGASSHGNNMKYLKHYEELQKFLDAYKTRQASVEFRRNVLRKQQKHNYQLEYDRIRSVLEHSLIPTTKEMIRQRMKVLEKLGAKAIDKIKDIKLFLYNIYYECLELIIMA